MLLIGCAGSLMPAKSNLPPLPSDTAAHENSSSSIGVLDEGWHTGLIVPEADLSPSLRVLRKWFPHAKYLAFGWGNRAFYTAPNPGSGDAISALLPSTSVLFIRSLPAPPATALPAGATLHWLCASPIQIRTLETYLDHYLRKGPHGRPISIAPGPWPQSRFFASTGRYDAFHTCNTWTAAALEFAGLPVSGQGVAFAWQVIARIHSLPRC